MRAGGKELESMGAEIYARLNHSTDWSQSRTLSESLKLRAGCVCSRKPAALLCRTVWLRRNCKCTRYRYSVKTENITISRPRSWLQIVGNTERTANFRRKTLSAIVTAEELKEGPCKQLCTAKHSAHQGDCRGARLNWLMSYISKWVWSGRMRVLNWTLPPLKWKQEEITH